MDKNRFIEVQNPAYRNSNEFRNVPSDNFYNYIDCQWHSSPKQSNFPAVIKRPLPPRTEAGIQSVRAGDEVPRAVIATSYQNGRSQQALTKYRSDQPTGRDKFPRDFPHSDWTAYKTAAKVIMGQKTSLYCYGRQ